MKPSITKNRFIQFCFKTCGGTFEKLDRFFLLKSTDKFLFQKMRSNISKIYLSFKEVCPTKELKRSPEL